MCRILLEVAYGPWTHERSCLEGYVAPPFVTYLRKLHSMLFLTTVLAGSISSITTYNIRTFFDKYNHRDRLYPAIIEHFWNIALPQNITMSETTCYGHSSPNAVILPNYGPCNPQAGSISLCCETGQTCLTNGLCVTQSGVYYSGGCTDNTYEAAVCPTFCTAGRCRAVGLLFGQAYFNIRRCQLGGRMPWLCGQGRGLLLLR